LNKLFFFDESINMLKINNIHKKIGYAFLMSLKLFKNDRTNKIVLYVILIALIAASVVIVSIIVIYLVSLEDSGGG